MAVRLAARQKSYFSKNNEVQVIRSIVTNIEFARGVAISIVIAWILWLLMIALIIFGDIFYEVIGEFIDSLIFIYIGIVSVYSLIAAVLLTRPKCRVCGEKIFSEPRSPHPNFLKRTGLGGWGTVIFTLVTKKNYVCMHCGVLISEND